MYELSQYLLVQSFMWQHWYSW